MWFLLNFLKAFLQYLVKQQLPGTHQKCMKPDNKNIMAYHVQWVVCPDVYL